MNLHDKLFAIAKLTRTRFQYLDPSAHAPFARLTNKLIKTRKIIGVARATSLK